MDRATSRRDRAALAAGSAVAVGLLGVAAVIATGTDSRGDVPVASVTDPEPIPVLRTDGERTVELRSRDVAEQVAEQVDDARDRIVALDSEANRLRAKAVVLYETEVDLRAEGNRLDARVEAARPQTDEMSEVTEAKVALESETATIVVERAEVAARLAEVLATDKPAAEEDLATAENRAEVVDTVSADELVLPAAAFDAYARAEILLTAAAPECGLRWWMLAGIGRIESGHGTSGGATADVDGNLEPWIVGPSLEGGAFAAISDTDGGELDTDPIWDHAVGPMQFLPSTWSRYASDANGDGSASPHNFFDATEAAGWYLCVAGGPLDSDEALRTAFLAYNHSDAYAAQVLEYARLYEAAGLPS